MSAKKGGINKEKSSRVWACVASRRRKRRMSRSSSSSNGSNSSNSSSRLSGKVR